jgi:hypothetical protein
VILRLNDQFGVSTDWMVSAGLPGHRATTISHRRQEAGLSRAAQGTEIDRLLLSMAVIAGMVP